MNMRNRKIASLTTALLIIVLIAPACQSNPTRIQPTPPIGEPETTSETRTIRIANGEWIPYNSEYLDHYGCDSWVVSEAFALQGITVEYGFFPWARSYRLAQVGEWDGTLAWADTPDHRKDFYISAEPTSIQEWVFFYRAGEDFDWQELSDLRGKRIGLTAGYVYSDVFAAVRDDPEMIFEEAPSDRANFDKLLSRHIDIFPLERQVGLSILKNYYPESDQKKIIYNQHEITAFEPYLLLSKKVPANEQIIQKFDAGWQELKESGRYDEIKNVCGKMIITPHD